MLKVVATISARMTSSRLPGKVLKDLQGKSVFYHHVERIRQCPMVDNIYLATSKNPLNKPLIEEAEICGIPYYAGAEEDILERYITIAKREKADIVVRIGGDQPLLSYEIACCLINDYSDEDLLYVATPLSRGVGVELFSLGAMEKIRSAYRGPAVSKYMFEYPHLFKIRGLEVDDEFSRPEFRLTLDTDNDYELLKAIYERFYEDGIPVDIKEVFKFLDDHPELANINRFTHDKEINWYVKALVDKPVFSIFQNRTGKYFVKNRMEEIIPYNEFQKALNEIQWEKGCR